MALVWTAVRTCPEGSTALTCRASPALASLAASLPQGREVWKGASGSEGFPLELHLVLNTGYQLRILLTNVGSRRKKSIYFAQQNFACTLRFISALIIRVFFDFCIWTLSGSIYFTSFENVTVPCLIVTAISPSQWPFLVYLQPCTLLRICLYSFTCQILCLLLSICWSRWK